MCYRATGRRDSPGDIEEEQAKRQALTKVVSGLASRCTGGIFLGYCQLGINGSEQGGRLLRAITNALTQATRHA